MRFSVNDVTTITRLYICRLVVYVIIMVADRIASANDPLLVGANLKSFHKYDRTINVSLRLRVLIVCDEELREKCSPIVVYNTLSDTLCKNKYSPKTDTDNINSLNASNCNRNYTYFSTNMKCFAYWTKKC